MEIRDKLSAAAIAHREASAELDRLVKQAKEENVPIAEIALLIGVTRPTVYRMLERK